MTERACDIDVLVVGAGISGVAAAYYLDRECPGKSFLVVDEQQSFGGTWHTHRYPGVRSDSDLHTFGYSFKPWRGKPIASGADIRGYLGEVIEDGDLGDRIRYRQRVRKASWDSADARWHVEIEDLEAGTRSHVAARFLWMCQGYYRHSEGYTPEWPGMETFAGRIVHPQTWPEDLDYRDKKVVIIGSGATAATLLPAMAKDTAHVTLLQRSPTYFVPSRNENELAERLRKLEIDDATIHEIVRRQVLQDRKDFSLRALREPEAVRSELLAGVAAFVGADMVEQHFSPSYRPWRQRIAVVPDGDLFQSIQAGRASVVTGHIDRFVPGGIALKSGEVLEADIIVTATGFNMNMLGDIAFDIDGAEVDFSRHVTYRGMMFTGVPNLAWVFGYFRYSWTLRSELIAQFLCRLFAHMDGAGHRRIEMQFRPEDADMALGDWIDPEDFNPGYLQRALGLLPKAGDKPEWRHTQDYMYEKDVLPRIDLEGAEFRYD